MKPPMLTLKDAAARIGCHPEALSRLMSAGKCPGAKIAGRWRVDADKLEAWIEAQQRQQIEQPHMSIEVGLPPVAVNPFA